MPELFTIIQVFFFIFGHDIRNEYLSILLMINLHRIIKLITFNKVSPFNNIFLFEILLKNINLILVNPITC